MVIDSLVVLKFSTTKEKQIEKKIVEVLQQTTYFRKKAGKKKIRVTKLLTLTLYLLARLTQTLLLVSAVSLLFLKSQFSELN